MIEWMAEAVCVVLAAGVISLTIIMVISIAYLFWMMKESKNND